MNVTIIDTVADQLPHPNINYMRRQLLLQVHKGKAFTAHLLDQPTLPGHTSPTYTLHLSFRGQRFRSRPAVCTEEPDIRESFLLELHTNDSQGLSLSAKLQRPTCHLKSVHYLECLSMLLMIHVA